LTEEKGISFPLASFTLIESFPLGVEFERASRDGLIRISEATPELGISDKS
jgi:hypothetical protein